MKTFEAIAWELTDGSWSLEVRWGRENEPERWDSFPLKDLTEVQPILDRIRKPQVRVHFNELGEIIKRSEQ